MQNRRLSVLGEVTRRFVVSPNIDALLGNLTEAEGELKNESIAMDIQ